MWNYENYDFSGLNHDVDNVQRITSDTYFNIQIPAVNLKRWRQQIRDSVALVRTVTTKVPQIVKDRGEYAVNVFQKTLLNGLTPEQIRSLIGTEKFENAVLEAENFALLRSTGTPASDAEKRILALSEIALYSEVDGEVAMRVRIDCGLFGTNC